MDKQQRVLATNYLRRLAEGDRSALDPLFALVLPLLKGFYAKSGLEQADVEDLVQQVMLKVFSRTHKYDRERDAIPWIMGIAAYELKTLFKKQQRSKEDSVNMEVLNSYALTSHATEQVVIDKQILTNLIELIGELSEPDQQSILSMLQGPSPRAKSALFRKRFQRAKDRLRKRWMERYGD